MDNPYAPSEQSIIDVNVSQVEGRPPLASKGKRILTYLIDKGIEFGIAIIIGAYLGFVMEQEKLDKLVEDKLFEYGLGYAISLSYYLLLEASCGRTIGKFVTGTKVLADNYRSPSFGQIFGRTFCRFVPFEIFSILSSSGKMWHDDWSNTITVDVRAKPLPPLRPYVPGQKPLIVKHAARPAPPHQSPKPPQTLE